MSLLCWNVVLNLPEYFKKALDGDQFGKFLFSYSLGGLLSFLLAPIIFKGFGDKKLILISLAMIGLSFFGCFGVCESGLDDDVRKYSSILLIGISGFFTSIFQSKSAG